MKIKNGRRVKLDKIKRKKGTSLVLRYWSGSQWITETLKDKLTGNRENDKELLSIAESMRSALENKLFLSGTEGASLFKGKTPFIKYYKEIMKSKLGSKCLTHLDKFPLKNRPLNSIDRGWIEEMKSFLLKRVKSPNSAFTYYANIKATLTMAVKEDIIRKSPANLVSGIKRVEREIEYLTEEEIEALARADTKSLETKRAFLFECFTGIRLGDLRKLTFGNIDIKENKINFIISKTKKSIGIPLHQKAKQLAFQNCNGIEQMPSNFVFPDLKGYNTISCQLKSWATKAGIKKNVHFHMGRSSFATLLMKEGVPIEVVSKLLGHTKISMTLQHYAKILEESKVNAISSLPDIKIGS